MPVVCRKSSEPIAGSSSSGSSSGSSSCSSSGSTLDWPVRNIEQRLAAASCGRKAGNAASSVQSVGRLGRHRYCCSCSQGILSRVCEWPSPRRVDALLKNTCKFLSFVKPCREPVPVGAAGATSTDCYAPHVRHCTRVVVCICHSLFRGMRAAVLLVPPPTPQAPRPQGPWPHQDLGQASKAGLPKSAPK